jgi:hypothetical protein
LGEGCLDPQGNDTKVFFNYKKNLFVGEKQELGEQRCAIRTKLVEIRILMLEIILTEEKINRK